MKTIPACLGAIALLALAAPAGAQEPARGQTPAIGLPGVDRGQPTPRPEPFDADAVDGDRAATGQDSPTHFRAGNWEVRIGGSISYGVGFSSRVK